jgi:hypothetical protein
MKRVLLFLATVAFCPIMALCQTTYVQTTREFVWTPSDDGSYWCDPENSSRSLTFDLESISGGTYLDIAVGKSIRGPIGRPTYYCHQDYNTQTNPSFPNWNGDFSYNYSTCPDNDRIYNMVFGFLRPGRQWKDLAVLRQTGTYIYLNTGNGIGGLAQAAFGGVAKDAAWGAFTYDDTYEDLAVIDGSNQVKVYRNQQNGTVNTTPVSFNPPVVITASRALFAQMDDDLYKLPTTNKWDLVSINGNTLSIRLNNGINGFNAPQDIVMGSQIYSVAVGDINNDNYNDVVVVMTSGPEVRAYLNNHNGGLITPALWTLNSSQYIPGNPRIIIGDIGAPGDATKNDGWNDVLLTGGAASVSIFINQQGQAGVYFLTQPQQQITAAADGVVKAMVADVQNTGGLSLISAVYYAPIGQPGSATIFINKHVGNPAPAPPKNFSWHGSAGQHPTFTWSANQERDLAGYNIYKNYVKLNTAPLTATSYVDLTQIVPEHGGGAVSIYDIKAVDLASNESASNRLFYEEGKGVEKAGGGEVAQELPGRFFLHGNYPNPFNPSTQIKFDLPEAGFVSLAVYDVLGRKVVELVNEYREAGYHTATWNAVNVSSGVYFARFTVANEFGRMQYSKMSKLLLMK